MLCGSAATRSALAGAGGGGGSPAAGARCAGRPQPDPPWPELGRGGAESACTLRPTASVGSPWDKRHSSGRWRRGEDGAARDRDGDGVVHSEDFSGEDGAHL